MPKRQAGFGEEDDHFISLLLQKRILAIILWGLVGLAIAALGLVWVVLQLTGGLVAAEAVYTWLAIAGLAIPLLLLLLGALGILPGTRKPVPQPTANRSTSKPLISTSGVRKVGIILLIGLVGYTAFHLIATRLNRQHWDRLCMEGLLNLQRSWIADGRPAKYDVARYYQSPSTLVHFCVDTNVYTVNGQTVSALFGAEYVWDKKSIVFLVTPDGVLFQRHNNQLLRR